MRLFSWLAPGGDAPRIRDPALVDSRFRRLRLQIIVSLTAGYGMAYTCRLGLSVVKKPLIDGNIFDAETLGYIGSAFLWGYGLGKLFNGFLADHTNIRRFIPLGLFLSAVINVFFGFNSLAVVALCLWGLNGWFQGFLAPASVVGLSQWFSGRERGTMYGIWSAAHSIGEGLTFVGTSLLVAATVWRTAFWWPGVLCMGAALAMYFTLRDRPETEGLPSVKEWKRGHGEPPPAGEDDDRQPLVEDGSKARAQVRLLLMPAVWICGVSSACMYVTRYAINSWGILYLQEHHKLSLEVAGRLLGINTLLGIAGSFAYGFISDRLFGARRPPVTLIFGALEVLSLSLVFFGPVGNVWVLALGLALYGFTLSGILAVLGGLFAVDMEPRAAGAAMGIVGCFSYIGAGLQEVISGKLIQAGTTMSDGARSYDFSTPIAVWVGASFVSMILAATLWKVKTKG